MGGLERGASIVKRNLEISWVSYYKKYVNGLAWLAEREGLNMDLSADRREFENRVEAPMRAAYTRLNKFQRREVDFIQSVVNLFGGILI